MPCAIDVLVEEKSASESRMYGYDLFFWALVDVVEFTVWCCLVDFVQFQVSVPSTHKNKAWSVSVLLGCGIEPGFIDGKQHLGGEVKNGCVV